MRSIRANFTIDFEAGIRRTYDHGSPARMTSGRESSYHSKAQDKGRFVAGVESHPVTLGQLADLQKLRQQTTAGVSTTSLKPVACPVDYSGGPGGAAA